MSGIYHLILTKNHGIIWDYGWMDNPTFTPWSPSPIELILEQVNELSKNSIFDYKPFKKWTSKPLLSCEYALMLDVLKTA